MSDCTCTWADVDGQADCIDDDCRCTEHHAPDLLELAQRRIADALEGLHEPEYLWRCSCCDRVRAALTDGEET